MPATGKMAAPSKQAQGIANEVLAKLIIFAILMAVLPIGTYFGTLDYVWKGNTSYAALSAVFAANVVLAGYVYVAFAEDAASQAKTEKDSRKTQ